MKKLPIRYTDKAETQLYKLITELREEWGAEAARKLFKEIKEAEKQIVNFPQMYPQSRFNNEFRKCVITKQTSLFYTILPDKIAVVNVFNNRQSTDKINP